MTSPHLTTDHKQAIPGDIRSAARGCICPKEAVASSGLTIARIERALLAERQKHDLPASPDLQAEAERVFADVQRAVLVEDGKQVIAKALRARDERAAKIAAKIASFRSKQSENAKAAREKTEARDFQSMAISATDVECAILSERS